MVRRVFASESCGFTLVEVMIVIIILGVLAGIAVPRFTVSSEDAKQSALNVDISVLERATELYKHQHRGQWPGARKYTDGTPVALAADAAASLVKQLTLYSNADGVTSNTRTAVYKFGPYLKNGIPVNPFNGSADVTCDITETDITVVVGAQSDGTGWKFYVKTGRVTPNHKTGVLVIKGVAEMI